MVKRWSKYLGAVLALLLVCGLVLVILMSGANLIQSYAVNVLKEADWTYEHTVQASYTARTAVNIYFILSGVVFLGFFFLMENRLVDQLPEKRFGMYYLSDVYKFLYSSELRRQNHPLPRWIE